MKEKVLFLLKEMLSDSKRASEEAECELCNLLTGVINKLREIDKQLGEYAGYYPDRITKIDSEWMCDELTEEISCNDQAFFLQNQMVGHVSSGVL